MFMLCTIERCTSDLWEENLDRTDAAFVASLPPGYDGSDLSVSPDGRSTALGGASGLAVMMLNGTGFQGLA
jgi:hypothetical protein